MIRKRFASVWDAIEDSTAEAVSMKLRAELANEIIERMRERKLCIFDGALARRSAHRAAGRA
jgi:predicted XRE-type DNA-binding protein